MSFWTNPVKAVTSWVRPIDTFLKAVLPAPIYTLVILLLSKEGKLIGQFAADNAADFFAGKISVPELAQKALDLGVVKLAKDELMTTLRAYLTPYK